MKRLDDTRPQDERPRFSQSRGHYHMRHNGQHLKYTKEEFEHTERILQDMGFDTSTPEGTQLVFETIKETRTNV